MFGITESARLLLAPAFMFIFSILAVIAVGFVDPHVQAVIGTHETPTITESLGIVLILKAFASGCSAVTGVEAIANGVPAFRKPRSRTAQRTEISLGILLGVMLVGIAHPDPLTSHPAAGRRDRAGAGVGRLVRNRVAVLCHEHRGRGMVSGWRRTRASADCRC